MTTHQTARNEWSIELLRGLAALLVVAVHYLPLTGWSSGWLAFAFTGVDLFFVLSGFVFAPYIFGKTLPLKAHAVRRLFRIYPLYAVALLVYAGLHWLQGGTVDHVIKHLLFVFTWETREVAFHFNPAFWSLPPEVEFYLALPLLAALAARGARAVSGAVAGVTVVALFAHLAIAYALPTDPAASNLAWRLSFHLPGLLIEFLLGAWAWYAVQRGIPLHWRWLLALVGLCGWCLLAQLFTTIVAADGEAAINAQAVLRGNLALYAALCFAAIVAAWVGAVKAPARWLRLLSQWLGQLSYGVYLFHFAAPQALAHFTPLKAELSGAQFALLCLLATLGFAWLMHLAVEAPLRELGRRWARAAIN